MSANSGVVPHGLNRAGLRDAQAKVEALEPAPLERHVRAQLSLSLSKSETVGQGHRN